MVGRIKKTQRLQLYYDISEKKVVAMKHSSTKLWGRALILNLYKWNGRRN